MTFAASIYVSASGTVYGASRTDQAYTRTPADARTVNGHPVAYAGTWYGSQMSYRPYADACRAAQARARMIGSTR